MPAGAADPPAHLVAHSVAIFPSGGAISPLVGAMLLEQNDEWAVSRARYMSLEKLASLSDDSQVKPQRIGAA